MKASPLFTFAMIAIGVALAAPGRLLAHAALEHAEPKVGSSVSKPPEQVKIWFSQDLEPAFSGIKVTDDEGRQVDQKDAHVDRNERNLLIVSLPSLPAGTYKVSWHVVSVDTHRTQGNFKYTVGS